jgi:glycosyltransferase involved in cell wall biosynthesis
MNHRILTVLPSVPLPADSGGRLRTLRLLEALDADFDVTVLALAGRTDDVEGLRARLRGDVRTARVSPGELLRAAPGVFRGWPLRYRCYAGPAMRGLLERALREDRYDAVHFDHLHTAPLLPVVRTLQPHALAVVDEHNVESLILRRLAERGGRLAPVVRREAARLERLEGATLAAADAVLACSRDDAVRLRSMGARNVQVVPNGADLPAGPAAARREDVIFVGSFDWRPNADAALELTRDVWPRVAPSLQEARLVLVGRRPPPEVRRLAGDRVLVTGTVRSVAPWLARSFASAIPLRAGSGTRIKILEAAAAGVPVVATGLAVEGLPFRDGREVLLAESADEFAGALLKLRGEPELAARIASAAAAAARRLAWTEVGRGLVSLYQTMLGEERAASQGRAAHWPAG